MANGKYYNNRDQVESITNGYWNKYAYFCKVEIEITGINITSKQSLPIVTKLCRVLVPILWSQHWPELDNLEN